MSSARLAEARSALTATSTCSTTWPGGRLGWEIENLADELSAVLGRPVDLVSRRALHERLRETVLADARLLYAA